MKKAVIPDLASIRNELGLTQQAFSRLLGVSIRAVHSYEQRWREPSSNVERMALLLLIAHRRGASLSRNSCWKETDCPQDRREQCMAYRSRQGHMCWFLTGTLCAGTPTRTWAEKRKLCSQCEIMHRLLQPAG